MLPISKQELEILLAGMKDLQVYYSDDRMWQRADKIDRIHRKLRVNINRYEEIEEDEEY